jgi:hypothetical protein
MGRKKLDIKRDRQLNMRLTAQEHGLLHQRAASAGMRPVDYARARLFSKPFRTLAKASETPHLDPLFLVSLSRIGNNINQIARQLNARAIPLPPSLEPLLQEVRTLIRRAAAP